MNLSLCIGTEKIKKKICALSLLSVVALLMGAVMVTSFFCYCSGVLLSVEDR